MKSTSGFLPPEATAAAAAAAASAELPYLPVSRTCDENDVDLGAYYDEEADYGDEDDY